MNWKNRLTNYNFWVSIFSAIILILQALKIDLDFIYVNEIVTAVLGLLVVIGIINDPTKSSKTNEKTQSVSDKEAKSENAENNESKNENLLPESDVNKQENAIPTEQQDEDCDVSVQDNLSSAEIENLVEENSIENSSMPNEDGSNIEEKEYENFEDSIEETNENNFDEGTEIEEVQKNGLPIEENVSAIVDEKSESQELQIQEETSSTIDDEIDCKIEEKSQSDNNASTNVFSIV